MRFRSTTFLLLLAAGLMASAGPAFADNPFKLKPGAKGKVCLVCHEAFAEKLKLPFVHTPVKKGDCSDCHNAHTSGHGKLLSAEKDKICFTCHEGVVPGGARSTHQVVVEGNCVKCHDPHAARNRNNLLVAGNGLCLGCHKELAAAIDNVQFRHSPVGKGCLTCHNPHASTQAAFLLNTAVPALCTRCHVPAGPTFAQRHMNYPVAKARCTSCHDPHGSNRSAILWTNVHRPVASRMCNQCHQDAGSADPLALKRSGFELCRVCHSGKINEYFSKNRVHWPLVDKTSCRNCHNPHASKQAALLRDPMKVLCGSCHADTMAREARSLTKHKPIDEGECTKCHLPHSSTSPFLFDNTSTINLCGKCHEWQKHSSHPIGEKFADPRNRNLTLDCRSCHRAHGTQFKEFTYFDPRMDLCVQCHKEYRRK